MSALDALLEFTDKWSDYAPLHTLLDNILGKKYDEGERETAIDLVVAYISNFGDTLDEELEGATTVSQLRGELSALYTQTTEAELEEATRALAKAKKRHKRARRHQQIALGKKRTKTEKD